MSISPSLKKYLEQQSAQYETLSHPRTLSSVDSAVAAHIPGEQLAKAVIVKDAEDYLMVVVPSSHHLHLGRLHHHLGHDVGLATEDEVFKLFPDCDEGAIPPVGVAYGFRTLVDADLMNQSDIFFESGDHRNLIKVSGQQFSTLLGGAERVQMGLDL